MKLFHVTSRSINEMQFRDGFKELTPDQLASRKLKPDDMYVGFTDVLPTKEEIAKANPESPPADDLALEVEVPVETAMRYDTGMVDRESTPNRRWFEIPPEIVNKLPRRIIELEQVRL